MSRDGFRHLLQSYSSSPKANTPGTMGHSYNELYNYFLQLKNHEFFEKYNAMDDQAKEENGDVIRQMLYRVIDVRLRPSQAPDFKRRVEFADSARILIDMSQGLFEKPDPAKETEYL